MSDVPRMMRPVIAIVGTAEHSRAWREACRDHADVTDFPTMAAVELAMLLGSPPAALIVIDDPLVGPVAEGILWAHQRWPGLAFIIAGAPESALRWRLRGPQMHHVIGSDPEPAEIAALIDEQSLIARLTAAPPASMSA